MVLTLSILVLIALAYEASQGADAPWTIAGVASNAGFSGADLVLAVAIAYGESSGNPNAVNQTFPDNSWGLWQINVNAHPEYDPQSLLDPQTNANAAYAIYQAAGNSFAPWGAYTNGSYGKYVDQATSEVGDLSADAGDAGDDTGSENG